MGIAGWDEPHGPSRPVSTGQCLTPRGIVPAAPEWGLEGARPHPRLPITLKRRHASPWALLSVPLAELPWPRVLPRVRARVRVRVRVHQRARGVEEMLRTVPAGRAVPRPRGHAAEGWPGRKAVTG